MEDLSLDFSTAAFSHQVPSQWDIPYSLLTPEMFSLFSRPNYFTESHLLWIRISELPVHNSAFKSSTEFTFTTFPLRTYFLWEHIKVTSEAIWNTTLCTYLLWYNKKQHPSSLTICHFHFTFKNSIILMLSFLINYHSLNRKGRSLVMTLLGVFPNTNPSTTVLKHAKNLGPTYWLAFPHGCTLFTDLYSLWLQLTHHPASQPLHQ